jgi:hypothetical protein
VNGDAARRSWLRAGFVVPTIDAFLRGEAHPMGDVNWAAVAVSTVVGFFLLGGLWYSKKVFGMKWGIATGMLDAQGNLVGQKPGEPVKHKHPGKVFGISFALALVSAVLFGWAFRGNATLAQWVTSGAVVGAGFVAASLGINYQFADRKTALWLIDGGYHTVQFVIYGLVFGLIK